MTFSHGSSTPFAPIIGKQESKVDVQSYVLLSFICPSDFQFCDYTFSFRKPLHFQFSKQVVEDIGIALKLQPTVGIDKQVVCV